jgi:hypothetical protein
MKRIPLNKFEALAQRLVEDSFKRLLGGRIEAVEVATRLSKALEDSQDGERVPDLYIIHLHPDDFDYFSQNNPQMADRLADYLTRLAAQAGLSLPVRPEIELTVDPRVARHKMRVRSVCTQH